MLFFLLVILVIPVAMEIILCKTKVIDFEYKVTGETEVGLSLPATV